VRFPPLKDLRAMFEKRHGPQEWSETTTWLGNDGQQSVPADRDDIPF